MTLSRIDVAMILAASVLAASAAHRSRSLVVDLAPAPVLVQQHTASSNGSVQRTAGVARDSAHTGEIVVANDMFRLSNAPATARYLPATEMNAGPSQPAVVRPRLMLRAIVGGPPWQAIVEGIPGATSPVVANGQVIGGFTIRRVDRDTVVIQGADTTWKLTLRSGPQ